MYNIRCELDIDVGKAFVRRITCVHKLYIKQLELPWDKNEKIF